MKTGRWSRAASAMMGTAVLLGTAHVQAGETWKRSDPITGVGDIIKTSPTGPSSSMLHYGGTRNPETASFSVNTADARDIDCNADTGERKDAGLHEADTIWTVPNGTGTIGDGGFTALFTPGDQVATNITVKVKVFEGHQYSWASNDFDPPVEKQWHQALTTFIVGVKMDPGNVKYYEDGKLAGAASGTEPTKKLIDLGSGSLNAYIPWTGWGPTPGSVQVWPSYPDKLLTWRALAETSTGSVGGIMGTINYRPEIEVGGAYKMMGGTEGFGPIGSLGTILITYAAKAYDQYAAAAVAILLQLTGTKTQYQCAMAGETVIENDTVRRLEEPPLIG
jgi:hypothetical protein